MSYHDQRIYLTRQRLKDSLLTLLQKKSIHSISIRELCENAGINRTTFYNHYGSQYDLLQDICSGYLAAIEERLSNADAANREHVAQRVTTVLAYFEENRELSVLLLNNNIDPDFAEKIFTLPKITDLLNEALESCKDPQRKQAAISFAIYGSYRLLLE